MMPTLWFIITLSFLKLYSTRAQYVETVFGSGTAAFGDGNRLRSHFSSPQGLSFDSNGNLYVADYSNNRIRKITPGGDVSVFAGSSTVAFADGQGAKASFNRPSDVAVDATGTVYVADTFNHRIRKISPLGNVTTLAGNGTASFSDGNATSASFHTPTGIAVDRFGNVYVGDRLNHRIRKITPDGDVTTLAGSGSFGLADGNAATARFKYPYELAIDFFGNLYFADQGNNRIRKISLSGEVTTFAGSGTLFNVPRGIAIDQSGNLIVADTGNNLIRKITPYGDVTTIAGSGKTGCDDGKAKDATFDFPTAVTVDAIGNIYISDAANHRIRKIITVENIPNIEQTKVSDISLPDNLGLVSSGGSLVAYDEDLVTNSTLFVINSQNDVIQLRARNNDLLYELALGMNQTGSLLARVYQDKSFSSVFHLIGDGNNFLQDIVCDSMGNIYFVGVYTNNATLRFSNTSTLVLPYVNSTQGGFIAKLAYNNSVSWIVTVEGGPLFLSVKVFGDTSIVTIKYAKQPSDRFPCIVTPVEGEKLYFDAIHNGVALIRISSFGRILWSNQINYAPWDQNQVLSVNRLGEISLTGWCSLPCVWYRNNETNPAFLVPSSYLGANFVFSADGTMTTGTPLFKFIRIDKGRTLKCSVGLQNSTLTVSSYRNNVSISIQGVKEVDVVIAANVAFISLNGIQRFKMDLTRFDEYIVSFSPLVEWSTCGRFNSQLGLTNIRGHIRNGTLAGNMDAQVGFLTSFSLQSLSPNVLIRFRPTSQFDFRCGVVNETHGLYLSSRSGTIELAMLLREQNGSFSGEPSVFTSVPLQSASLSLFAFILRGDQVTLYLNGEQLYQFEFINATDFLLTTFNSDGEFDLMGILTLPQPYESWLTYDTDSYASISTSMYENLHTNVEKISFIPTETSQPDVKKEWTLFGLSGLILYLSVGAAAFGITLLLSGIIISIFVLRKRRRLKMNTHQTNYNFTTVNQTKSPIATLVNSEYN